MTLSESIEGLNHTFSNLMKTIDREIGFSSKWRSYWMRFHGVAMTKEEKIADVMELVDVVHGAAWDSGECKGNTDKYARIIDDSYGKIRTKLRELIKDDE